MASIEEEIARDEQSLADFKNVEETMRLNQLVEERRSSLEKLLAEWEEVAELIELNS